MLIDTTAIANLRTAFQGLYQSAYSSAAVWGPQIATQVPSSTRSNTYGWMEQLPKMREWIGPRELKNLAAASYTITNKPYEETVVVDRDDLEDDNLGVYNPLMAELGRVAAKWQDDLLAAALQAGTSALCHDGGALFRTTHAMSGTNQSNLFTGTALTQANYEATRATMMTYQGEGARSLGVMPDTLIVPPQLEYTARTIIAAATNSSGATNVSQGTAKVVVVPELSSEGTVWYLADCSRAIKPLVFQQRKAPEFVSKDSPTDDNVFSNRSLVYGVDARGSAGYSLWFLIARAAQ